MLCVLMSNLNVTYASSITNDVDINIKKSYNEKENNLTLTVEKILNNKDIIIESVLNPYGEEIYDKESGTIKNKTLVVSENKMYQYTVKYRINNLTHEEINTSEIKENTYESEEKLSEVKTFEKVIKVSEIKDSKNDTVNDAEHDKNGTSNDIENSTINSNISSSDKNISFLAEIKPNLTKVDGNTSSEYNYIIKYKIPPFNSKDVYIEIKLNGNIALKDNVSLAPGGLTYIGYDKSSNIIRLKVNENLSDQEITGTFNLPVNFINAKDGNIANAEIVYKDDIGGILGSVVKSEDTVYNIKYPVALSKEKMGSELIFLDGKAQYRVRVLNKDLRDLGGYSITDYLPDDKDIELIDVYMGNNKGKKLAGVASINYNEQSKQIKATINNGRKDEYFYLYIELKYKNISNGEWITNRAELHDSKNMLLKQDSARNKVAKGKGEGKFDKIVSKHTFGYNESILWTIKMENSGSGNLDKLVMQDDFQYHTRVTKIDTGFYNKLHIDPNINMKIYIKTKKEHKDNYFLYKEVGYDVLTKGNIFDIDEKYTTDDNYVTSIKIEVENVPPGLNHVKPIRIYTKMLPNYEDGSTIMNGTIITNTAKFSVIENNLVVAETEHSDSSKFNRAYIGNINKIIVSDIPNKIGDEVKYKIEVTSGSESNLPRPIIWDNMPENLSYQSYDIKIVDKLSNQIVDENPKLEFENTKNGILRWKLDEVLEPNQKIVIDLTAKLDSIKYTNTNNVGLSTKDIPLVQGVAGEDNKTTNENGIDYDGNGQFGDMYTYDNVSFNIVGSLNISAEKYIKDGNEYKKHASFVKGDRIDYKLVLRNNSKQDLKNIVIYDNLPAIGDKGTLYDKDRLSEFNVNLVPGSIKISTNNNNSVPHDEFYSISLNPERVNSSGNGVIGDGVWETNIANHKDIKAIKMVMDPQFTLSSDQELIIEYSVDIAEDSHGELKSYNNFSADANGLYPIVSNTVEAIVKDYGVVLTKVDADNNGITLEGAEFSLLDAQDREIQTKLTTNKAGKITVGNLKPGRYKFVETKAPEGYVLNSTPIEFEIVKSQQTEVALKVENTLKTGSVVLTKVDADNNGITLEGAEFSLLDAQDREIQTKLTTNKAGKITVGNLKPGRYKFVETKAPEGYVLNSTPIEFEIVKNQQTEVELTAKNNKKIPPVKPPVDPPVVPPVKPPVKPPVDPPVVPPVKPPVKPPVDPPVVPPVKPPVKPPVDPPVVPPVKPPVKPPVDPPVVPPVKPPVKPPVDPPVVPPVKPPVKPPVDPPVVPPVKPPVKPPVDPPVVPPVKPPVKPPVDPPVVPPVKPPVKPPVDPPVVPPVKPPVKPPVDPPVVPPVNPSAKPPVISSKPSLEVTIDEIKDKNVNPQTGDSSLAWYVGLMLFSSCMILLNRKNKKSQ